MKNCLLLLLMLTTACVAGTGAGDSAGRRSVNYSIALPDQWVEVTASRHFMMTKDGVFSQYILVQQRHVEEPFRHTKRTFDRQMLPQEAAQVVLDEIASDRSVLNFKVIENKPTRLNRYDGFRVVFTYKTSKGSEFKTTYYGFLKGDWFYSVRYNVSDQYDTREGYDDFETVLDSFRIKGA
jgi:hypothetical protein